MKAEIERKKREIESSNILVYSFMFRECVYTFRMYNYQLKAYGT